MQNFFNLNTKEIVKSKNYRQRTEYQKSQAKIKPSENNLRNLITIKETLPKTKPQNV